MATSLTGMFLASFLLVLLFGAFLLQVGLNSGYIGLLMLSFLMGVYVFSGIFAKTMRLKAFFTAERSANPFIVGQAIASGIISSGIFILLAGDFYERGTDALAGYSGWILGSCLMVVLFAASVNRSAEPTLAGFLNGSNSSRLHRGLSLFAVSLVGFILLTAQFRLTASLSETFLGISGTESIIMMVIAIGICLLMGGVQALSISRMLAYPVIAIGFLLPISMIAYKISGNPFPQLAYGSGALEPIMQIDREIIDTGFAEANEIFSLTKSRTPDIVQYLSILFCLACGLAAMPHLLQHFTTSARPSQARLSGAWAIGLTLLVLTAIPAFAAFYRIDIYTSLLGLQLADLEGEAAWIFNASGNGSFNAITICGAYISSLEDAMAACGQGPDYFLATQDISVNPSLLVLSSGILNEMPPMVTWVLATGALAAIWSTADGIAIALANSLAHDGYVHLVRPGAPQSIRLFIARFLLIMILVVSATLAIGVRPDAIMLFELAFSFSAAALFPALVTRIWWPACGNQCRFAGVLAGIIITSALLFLNTLGFDFMPYSGDEWRFAANPETERPTLMSSGMFGMFGAFLAIWISHVAIVGRLNKKSKPSKENRNVPAKPETV